MRRASKLLHEHDARQKESSWKRTLNRALDPDDPYVFSAQTAAVVAEFLGKPVDYFVRPQRRETNLEKIARLEAENAELSRRLAGSGGKDDRGKG